MRLDETLKSRVLVILQFVSLLGAIYGVYADASKNLEAAKTARDKQITELNLALTLTREEIATLKRDNDHLRQWIKGSAETGERQHDRVETRLGRLEMTLMQRK